MLQPINFLVMDEPTNHLDMRAKDVLKMALQQFDGTLLVVSHDREFLTGLVNRVYEFRDGKTKEYLGGIEYFLEQRKLNSMRMLEKKSELKATKTEKISSTDNKDLSFKKKESEKLLRKLRNSFEQLEKEIDVLENRLAELDDALLNPEKFKELAKDPDYYQKYELEKAKLETCMRNWEELASQIDMLESELQTQEI
jgi:ATP-binding cassette subfamily F protein 3